MLQRWTFGWVAACVVSAATFAACGSDAESGDPADGGSSGASGSSASSTSSTSSSSTSSSGGADTGVCTTDAAPAITCARTGFAIAEITPTLQPGAPPLLKGGCLLAGDYVLSAHDVYPQGADVDAGTRGSGEALRFGAVESFQAELHDFTAGSDRIAGGVGTYLVEGRELTIQNSGCRYTQAGDAGLEVDAGGGGSRKVLFESAGNTLRIAEIGSNAVRTYTRR